MHCAFFCTRSARTILSSILSRFQSFCSHEKFNLTTFPVLAIRREISQNYFYLSAFNQNLNQYNP